MDDRLLRFQEIQHIFLGGNNSIYFTIHRESNLDKAGSSLLALQNPGALEKDKGRRGLVNSAGFSSIGQRIWELMKT